VASLGRVFESWGADGTTRLKAHGKRVGQVPNLVGEGGGEAPAWRTDGD